MSSKEKHFDFPLIMKVPVSTIFLGDEVEGMNSYIRRTGHNKAVLIDGGNPQLQVTDILDSNGNLYKVHKRKFIRKWLLWLSPIVDLVRIECDLEFIKRLTIGEALDHMKSWTDVDGRRIKQRLEKYDADSFLDINALWDSWL